MDWASLSRCFLWFVNPGQHLKNRPAPPIIQCGLGKPHGPPGRWERAGLAGQLTEGDSMDVQERIRNELGRAPVVLFMKGTPDFPQCGFSAQTAGALRKLGVQFHSVNIFDDPEL